MFLPPPGQPLELHDLEGEARLFSSREAATSGSLEVRHGCGSHSSSGLMELKRTDVLLAMRGCTEA